MTTETLKTEYNTLKQELEDLNAEHQSFVDLYSDIQWIYAQLKQGVQQIELDKEVDAETDEITVLNQDVYDKWEARWDKIDAFLELFSMTRDQLTEELVRSYGQHNSAGRGLNEKAEEMQRKQEKLIDVKKAAIELKEKELQDALFEAEGIERVI